MVGNIVHSAIVSHIGREQFNLFGHLVYNILLDGAVDWNDGSSRLYATRHAQMMRNISEPAILCETGIVLQVRNVVSPFLLTKN